MNRVTTQRNTSIYKTWKRACIAPLCLPVLFAVELAAAPSFSPYLQPLGSVAPLSLSNTDLSGGGVKGYRTWFENGGWQGDLVEYDVSNVGALSTSVDLSGLSPTNDGNPPANWSAHVRFALQEIANANYWDTGRTIVTWDGSNQQAFRWENLSATQKAELDQIAFDSDKDNSDVLNYIRGERSNESPGGSLRHRAGILGDLIHSNPVYVGRPRGSFTENDYATFVNYTGVDTDGTAEKEVGLHVQKQHLKAFDTLEELQDFLGDPPYT